MNRVFIATVGLTPQVVTLAFDELLQKGMPFTELCIIHTEASQPHRPDGTPNLMHQSMARIDAEFTVLETLRAPHFEVRQRVSYRPPWAKVTYELTLRKVCVRKAAPGGYIACEDANTRTDAKAAFNTIFQTVRAYKGHKWEVHFCIAGGRKSMGAFAMGAAQLLFDQNDGLYHLMSTIEFERTEAMHEETRFDLADIIQIPVIFLGSIAPQLTRLLSGGDPFDAVATQDDYMLFADASQKDEFVATLTQEQQDILRLVTYGFTNPEIAKQLNMASSTVANKLPTIFDSYFAYTGRSPDEVGSRKRAFMIGEFAAYFRRRG